MRIMAFVALDKESRKRIDITEIENPRITLKSGECICQLCGAPLMIKAGLVIRPHFAHYSSAECASGFIHHPESPEHREAKAALCAYLKTEYAEYSSATIEKEVAIPEIRRVADLLATFPMGWAVAHEIQLAGITTGELKERTDDYASIGIDVVWWLGKSADTPANRDWCTKSAGGYYRIFGV